MNVKKFSTAKTLIRNTAIMTVASLIISTASMAFNVYLAEKIGAQAIGAGAQLTSKIEALPADSYLRADLTDQISSLIFDGFLRQIPSPWLMRLPVWLRGIDLRLQALDVDPRRDLRRMAELDPVLDAYADLLEASAEPSDEVNRIGYLIEEFRLQVFAQSLGTIETVSAKRILKAIADYSSSPG